MKLNCQIILLCLSLFVLACNKKSPDKPAPKGNIHNLPDSTSTKDQSINNLNKSSHITTTQVELTPSFVPESGKSNWAVEFDAKKEHTVGIFRLPDLSSWQELISTMEYAPEAEIKNSFVFEPNADWWVKRDIKTNIFQHKLLCYKKKDKGSVWFFAFNKNREVYFWK